MHQQQGGKDQAAPGRSRPMQRLAACALGLAAALLLAGCGEPGVPKLMDQARSALAANQVEAARLHLKSALQQAPDNAEARFLLGQILHDSADFAGAEVELRRALELRHPEAQVLPLLANALLGLGKGALLLQQFGNATLADADAQTRLSTSLAGAEAATGNLDAAAARLDGVLRRQPDLAAALLLQVRLSAARGDLAAARSQAQALTERQPGNAEAWQLLGDLLQRPAAGQSPPPSGPALAAYRKALELRPDGVSAHAAVINLLLAAADVGAATTQWQALQKVAPQHPQTLFFEAVLASQKGDAKRARELTQQLLRGAPNNPQVLLLAGQSELQLNNLAQAELHFAKVLQLAPQAQPARRQLAQVLVRSGQADKALATLAPLLAGASDVETLTLAAQAQLMKGDTAAADASFARAARLKPDDPRVRLAVALSKVSRGGGAPALAELRAVAAADKGHNADLALINALLRNKDLGAALKAVDVLAAKLPDDALPHQLRGRIALEQQDSAAARRHFEAALAKNADYLPALAGLAALDVAAKQPDAAKARFEALLQRNPRNTAAMLALAELSSRSGAKPEVVDKWLADAVAVDASDPAPRLLQIDQFLAGNRRKQALDAAQAGLVALPDNPELLDRLGRMQLQDGDTQQALATFGKLAAAAPRSALAQLRLADAHTSAGNASAVAQAVRRAAELAPEMPLVQQAQVALALRENKPDVAMAIARKTQAARPDDAAGHLMEGEVATLRKDWDGAAAALRKALVRQQPADAAARLHAVLLAAKKTAEADAHALDWRQKHPEDMAFVLYLGDQAMAAGNTAQAEPLYRQVLERQPANTLALNNLAYALAQQKKPGGVALAEQALKLAPKSAAVMDTLAAALAAEQQLPRAVEVQRQAVAAAPEAAQLRLRLARLLVEAGDKSNARSELSALAALGNRFPRQAEVAALIKQIDQ